MHNIVGISALFHDSAACLLQNGRLTAAAQEERFSRQKHDCSAPKAAFRYCLQQGRISLAQLDCLAYYEQPLKKLERQISMMLPDLTPAAAEAMWRRMRQPMHDIRRVLGYEGPVEIVSHHEAHAASCFYFSGFEEAALLTVDAVGEWATTTYGFGCHDGLQLFEEVHFPDSIGLLYSAITSYLGFGVNDGEYKVMGLAPYGRPNRIAEIRKLIESAEDGQFRLDMTFFDFTREDRMYSDHLLDLFANPPRARESEITQFHSDVARSLQAVLEELLLEKSEYLFRKTGSENLCMAGGVALNCVANSRILRDGPFKRLFVQPAAGDAGGSLGAAALAHARCFGRLPCEPMRHAYLGPEYPCDTIAALLSAVSISHTDFRGREEFLLDAVADRLAVGEVVGWFQGRMEFGPRALGARSILADPRIGDMRDRINALVKMRESFRPFAPAVLEERAAEHFQLDHASPFMLETFPVRSLLSLPAITHADNSARVQTVNNQSSPRFARLLQVFEQHTGCPLLLNTSFNMRDEPIVCSPIDALICFARSQLDALVLEDFLIERNALPPHWNELLRISANRSRASVSDRVYTLM